MCALFACGVGGKVDAEFLKDAPVFVLEHDGRVGLTSFEHGQRLESESAVLVSAREDGESH